MLTDMLSKIVARLSLVVSLYEEDRKDDCGADHHRMIVAALRAKGLMDHHLAGVEGRVRTLASQPLRTSHELVRFPSRVRAKPTSPLRAEGL